MVFMHDANDSLSGSNECTIHIRFYYYVYHLTP